MRRIEGRTNVTDYIIFRKCCRLGGGISQIFVIVDRIMASHLTCFHGMAEVNIDLRSQY